MSLDTLDQQCLTFVHVNLYFQYNVPVDQSVKIHRQHLHYQCQLPSPGYNCVISVWCYHRSVSWKVRVRGICYIYICSCTGKHILWWCFLDSEEFIFVACPHATKAYVRIGRKNSLIRVIVSTPLLPPIKGYTFILVAIACRLFFWLCCLNDQISSIITPRCQASLFHCMWCHYNEVLFWVVSLDTLHKLCFTFIRVDPYFLLNVPVSAHLQLFHYYFRLRIPYICLIFLQCIRNIEVVKAPVIVTSNHPVVWSSRFRWLISPYISDFLNILPTVRCVWDTWSNSSCV